MRVQVEFRPQECVSFARDTWSLEEAALINDQGLFMYLQDVMVMDAPIKVAPRLSALDHLTPDSDKVQQWWYERRKLQRIDDKLLNECRVFCDPRFARDASEEERVAANMRAQAVKRSREEEDVKPSKWSNRGPKNREEEEEASVQPSLEQKQSCQVILKGIAPSGAQVIWRCNGWRPFFFVLVESLPLNQDSMVALREALTGECKLETMDQVQIELVQAPRLLPFAYDPQHPDRPKQLDWWKISFPTVQAKKRAARFMLNKQEWTLHPRMFRFPHVLKQQGFQLAEHVLDESKMLMKTCQININTWLTVAHDAVRHLCAKAPLQSRASIAQFEWIIPSPACLAVFENNPLLQAESKDSELDRFARVQTSTELLQYEKDLWHARTAYPRNVSQDSLLTCLPDSTAAPPVIDATVDIEVSGNVKDPSIFPEPQHDDYVAYLIVTVLSFKGSVPKVWRDRGIQGVNEAFAILVHSMCPFSEDGALELSEKDLGTATRVFGCVERDESKMYEIWSDWTFRVAQTDLLSHFNGDKFDMPYILCRLTGNKMRPQESYVRQMRASRFPWMCVIWSIPVKPYWKRVRARDKRTKKSFDPDAEEEEEIVEEEEDEEEEAFEEEDNLIPVEDEVVEKPPEEEVTDLTQFDMIFQVFGLATLDLLKFVKEIYKNFEEYTLNYLAHLKLKDLSKLDVKPEQITRAWHFQDRPLLELVTSYCVRDVVVTVKLDKSFQAFMTMNALAFASTTPLSTLLISGSQKRLLNCLVQFSSARGFICNGIRETRYASTGSYAGGKVQDAVPGIHKTTCVDFASLYPSIMQCKNLCYTTFVPQYMVDKMSSQDRVNLKLECFEPRPGVKYWFVQSFMGVVPAMLNYFVTRRRQVQRESKDAFAKGNDALGKILDLLQLALKILANATYGFTGVGKTKGPMLGLQAISETTTFLGRSAITWCHQWLTDGSFVRFLRDEKPELMARVPPTADVEVVYGDTDSLFFSWTEDLPMPLIFLLGNESGDFLTTKVREVYVRHTDKNNPFKVEHEKSGWGLYIRKKMYAMVKFESVEDCEKWETTGQASDKALMIRGLRPTRRDTFGLLRTKGKQILKEMLEWVPFDPESGRTRMEHRQWVIERNVEKVLGTLNEVVRTIVGAHTMDQAKREELCPLFQQTGELRAEYSDQAAVAPHMAIGWKFHYDFGSRVPFILCTEPDVERLKRPDGKHSQKSLEPKYNLSQTYGPSGYNVRDFTKPYKSRYGKAAYARHPKEEYLAPGSRLQINRSHYLQLFYQLVNIFFVKGIPGAEHVPSIFLTARGQIHRETIGVVSLESMGETRVQQPKSVMGGFRVQSSRK